MQNCANTLHILLLVPLFFAVEFTRAALWAARAVDEPDRDGPLLRALLAFFIGLFSVVPSPVLAFVRHIAWLTWMPARGVLLLWGIGREGVKKGFSGAVSQWYESTRAKRAKMLQR